VGRLRALVRLPSGGEALINLGGLVQDVCDMLHFQIERANATLDVDVARDVLVQADPLRYRLLIAALVLAANDVGGERTAVSIRVYGRGTRACTDISSRCGDRTPLGKVAAAMQSLPLTHRWSPGALAPYIHLGPESTVSMDLRPDGLTFGLVTRRVEDVASDSGERTSVLSAEMPTCRVLVVDDDAATATITAEMLRVGLNCETDVARSLSDAWKLLGEWRYDMVITDLHIGHESGLELVTGLRSLAPSLADATILTSSDPALREVAGSTRFLSKPFTSEELVSAARLVGSPWSSTASVAVKAC
jgi:CheY-like chemotaxis protein